MKINMLILLLLCGIIMAQPRGPMGGGFHTGERSMLVPTMRNHPAMFQGKQMHPGRGQNREKVAMMMMWRMTEELSLTEDQAAVLFPRLNKHREEMEQIDNELKEISDEIRKKVNKDQTITDKYFEESLKKINELEHKRVDARNTFIKSMQGTLSNEQVIKLSTLDRQFKREIRQKMQEGRQKGQKGGNEL